MWEITIVRLLVFSAIFSLASVAQAGFDVQINPDSEVGINTKRHFVVTLRSSFTPISDKQAKRNFPNHPVYLLQSLAFGKTVYLMRIGFFNSFAEATAFRERVLAKYPAALVAEILENEFSVIQTGFEASQPTAPKITTKRGSAGPTPSAPSTIASVPVAPPSNVSAFSPRALYAIQLADSNRTISAVQVALPVSLRKYRLYVTQTHVNDRTRYQLKLGFFESELDVYAARKQLKATFPASEVTRITLNEQENSVRTALSVTTVKPTVEAQTPKALANAVAKAPTVVPNLSAVAPVLAPAVKMAPASSYDSDAKILIDKSRAALARSDNASAITALDKLLRLPPNHYSQDAQELIGLARQRAGESAAALQEYELYLRLYPTGEGSDRVRQRIAALDATISPTPSPTLTSARPRVERQSVIVGNFSQYYYHGASKLDSTTLTPTANTQNQASLTQTDQNALVTDLNFMQQYRSENYDNRMVLRDTYTKSFLQGQNDTNRPTAIYYELKDRLLGYSARIGRQPGGSGGVLGRFDGIQAGYDLTPKWRVNVVGGVPTDMTYDSSLRFYGTSVDIGPYAGHWGASFYTIEQKADGVIDRRAIGTELRFFYQTFTMYGLFDYDTEFKTQNITLLQGNWNGSSGTSAHVLFDRRKTPSLELVNSLIGEFDTSITSQLQTKTYQQLKQQALDLTSTTELRSAGVSQALTARWQAGFDVQSAHTSSTVGTLNQPPQPDTGTIYTYTGSLIGSGIITQRDVNVISVSRIDGPTSTGNSYAFTNRLLWGPSWSLDSTLSWYKQHDSSTNTDMSRLAPSLKPSYKWKHNITFEAELGEEHTTTRGPTEEDKITRRYWSLGYRWDF
ncbi:MAG: tetratricopeptide repeat protein [Sulfuricaulis sp.]